MRTLSRYYPFGMLMPERTFTSPEYRYGFSGKENTDELNGVGNEMDFGARIYDTRLARWLSLDAEFKIYPYHSPYIYANNSPQVLIDEDGNKFKIYYEVKDEKTGKTKIKHVTIKKLDNVSLIAALQKSGSNPYVQSVLASIVYLRDADAKEKNILGKLASAKRTIKIKANNQHDDGYDPVKNTIYWDPKSGIKIYSESGGRGTCLGVQSPAMGLFHEATHAWHDLFRKLRSNFRKDISDSKFNNKNEKDVIKIENKVGARLNEPERANYDGVTVTVDYPTQKRKPCQ